MTQNAGKNDETDVEMDVRENDSERSAASADDPREAFRRQPVVRAMHRAIVWSSVALVIVFAIAALWIHARAGLTQLASAALAFAFSWVSCTATSQSVIRAIRRGKTGGALTRRMIVSWAAKLCLVIVAAVAVIETMDIDRAYFGILLAIGIVVGENVNILVISRAPIPTIGDEIMRTHA